MIPTFTVDYLDRVRQRTRRVAACIPAEHIEWAPYDGAFTLGDVVRHIAATERYMWAETVAGRPSSYTTHARELADGRDAVLAFLERMHTESMEIFRGLDDAALEAPCHTPEGAALPAWKWLRAMTEHEIHHRGQIYLMLGILGVKTPPIFGLTSEELRRRAGAVR